LLNKTGTDRRCFRSVPVSLSRIYEFERNVIVKDESTNMLLTRIVEGYSCKVPDRLRVAL
jgi:hypothetical protein